MQQTEKHVETTRMKFHKLTDTEPLKTCRFSSEKQRGKRRVIKSIGKKNNTYLIILAIKCQPLWGTHH